MQHKSAKNKKQTRNLVILMQTIEKNKSKSEKNVENLIRQIYAKLLCIFVQFVTKYWI